MALRDRRLGGFATRGTGFGTFPSFGQSTFDLNTPQGLLDLAMTQDGAVAQAAFELMHPEKSMLSQIGSGMMNTFAGFIDIITVPEQIVVGIIDPDISIGEAIEENIRPSDMVFGEADEDMSAMTKVGNFFLRTAIDILLDPLTYVSFGARAGAQAIQVAGEKKFLTEVGEEFFQKRIQNQVKGLAKTAEITGKLKGLEGEALEKLVKETIGAGLDPNFTKKAMGNLIAQRPDLAQKFIDKGGIKVFGETLLSAQRIDSATRMIPGFTYLDNLTKPTRNILGSLFNRDVDAQYGALPQEFIDIEQRARDLVQAKKITTMTDLTRVARVNKMTSLEAEDLMNMIEHGKIPADPRLAGMWRQLKGINKKQLKSLQRAGFKVHEQISHMPHVLVDEAVTVLPFRLPPKTSARFAESRRTIIGTVEEVNEAIGRTFFDPNAISALAKRGFKIDTATTMSDFVNDIARNFGVVASKAPDGYVRASVQGLKDEVMDFASFAVGKNMEELYFHPAIAKRIETFTGALINDEATNVILKEFDSLQRMWKASVTSIFPAFHGRNAISNVFQNFLDLGVGALDPARQTLSVDMMVKNRNANQLFDTIAKGGTVAKEATEELNELLLREVFTDRNGYKWTFGELRTTIQNHQIAFNPNLTGAMDIRVPTREFVDRLFPETSKAGIAKKIPGKVFEKGRQVGNIIENHARLVNFLTHLQKTGDPVFAAQRTKQFLFDYQNLSNFEKTFMRRLIPFYTWTRKNLELQARTLFKTPGRITAQIRTFQNLGEVFGTGELSKEDREKLPQWAVDGFSVLKSKKGETVEILANLGTPLEQTFQFFQPGKFLGSISPFIRVPLELASGYNFFQQKPISEVTNAAAFKKAPDVIKDFIGFTEISGKRKDGTSYTWYTSLRPNRLHLLLNLPPTSRVLSTMKQIEAVDVPQGSKILQQLVGVRPFTFDLEREEVKRERELKKQLEQLLINAGTVSKFERTFIPK